MYRTALNELKNWKSNPRRKPLIIDGARQVGKTWLIKKFGAESYQKVAYVNLEKDDLAREIFEGSFEPKRIITRLSLHLNIAIEPDNTLIIIDEAQENPRVLTALKYFQEETPEYHIIIAGSLLGIAIHQNTSFPVGKVDHLRLHPLSFYEFLIATGKEYLAIELKAGHFDLIAPFHDELTELHKIYTIVGGMPEVVKTYLDSNMLISVRDIQQNILNDYERDFSKYADRFTIPKIIEIFNTIPAALAKENKKFMFGMIKSSARAREYDDALLWLNNAGVATRVNRIRKIGLPLAAYEDINAFKLFYVDIGLLGCKAKLRPETVYNEPLYQEFKGAMCEQYIFQELRVNGQDVYYYSSDDSRTEIDFVIDTPNGLLPIEVKSGKSLASASLNKILDENPHLTAIKFSALPYKKNANIINMPLYGACALA